MLFVFQAQIFHHNQEQTWLGQNMMVSGKPRTSKSLNTTSPPNYQDLAIAMSAAIIQAGVTSAIMVASRQQMFL